ncbi:DUF2252 domain-containing protein [Arthrobacter koreensis]|uniref:DUF2252 domain-containing protein n=1 Tax=Arthrobacter koreensis TaxID=199136 RepID=A0ABY6FP28_9MICC|nr:DUF2252 domain-containing protein [Arthrobacter koreensis]UYB34941.1 DUF2252 domain-containing protein [Arthrobacter koreensis]
MVRTRISHSSVSTRTERGRSRREKTPRSLHAAWEPAARRPDPVALLEEQNLTREPDLVPVRHGRMLASPLAFYRGAAKIMAADLRDIPRSGLNVQLCGDAHLSNFGLFASPERRMLFDLNDFDETLPGPFEYDVLRMGASFTVAARNNLFSPEKAQKVTEAAVRSYREAMLRFASLGVLQIWYARLEEEDVLRAIRLAAGTGKGRDRKKAARRAGLAAEKTVLKARSRDSLQALSKLAELVDGKYRIASRPPIVIPAREAHASFGMSASELRRAVNDQFTSYRQTLQDDRRHLLERFEIVDAARKVVGVGSVGTRSFIVLLQGRDSGDPLFLQVKEATRSVLEDHLPASEYRQPGERVVQGQRSMQAASDPFLGWTRGVQANRYMYWRQLRDMKGSAEVEAMRPAGMEFYAHLCGWTLARAHARTGDPVALAAYLGRGTKFDKAASEFCRRYADQNDADYQSFAEAVRSGRISAVEGV